ncbi:MAG: glycosyltransferase [Aquificaceae bacterium]|nr:glycosyltransferase [Aquificaceae bacterium]
MTITFLLALFVSFFSCLFIIVFNRKWKSSHMSDMPLSGPQKFHTVPTPRLGGVGLVLGLLTALIPLSLEQTDTAKRLTLALLSASFVFFSGLIEDLTKRFGWKERTIFMVLGSLTAVFTLDARIVRVDLSYVDSLLNIWLLSVAFSVFAMVGLTNAINIIDGFNGLASMVSIIMFLAFGFVAFKVGDYFLFTLCLLMVSVLAGFFLFNYPNGLIFLGDGGAYFTGFMLALVAILLVKNHPDISAWFPVVVCVYPIFEVLFSIYRKAILRNMSPFVPDGLHLHMLFYKRLTKLLLGAGANKLKRNASTSPFLWLLSSLGVVPGVLWWNSTPMLVVSAFLFAFVYLFLYWKVLMRRPPSWAR